MASTNATFEKIPYLNIFPLETRFPFISPDDSRKRSRPATLACTRIAILGSLKAARLQGAHRISGEPSLSSSHSKKPSLSESYIFDLLTNPITEPVLLSYLTTRDLIALRQTSRFLRANIDRQHRLWRSLNLSYPRTGSAPDISYPCRSNTVIDPLRYLKKIIDNHAPYTPISPYHHTRVLILDNYQFKATHRRIMEDLLYNIFTNQCLWANLKLLSIRGFRGLSIAEISGYLRDWEVGIRGKFRKTNGWRYLDTPDGGFQVIDRCGKVVDRNEWFTNRGWALEVFRFACPSLLQKGVPSFLRPSNYKFIPVPIPSYLSLSCYGEMDEDGTIRPSKYYQEEYTPLPLRRADGSNVAELHKAMRLAERIGLELDVGFCKNETGHAKFKYDFQEAGDQWWGICERRWERCVTQGCRWEGWTEACSNCRWGENWCCKGCYSWVCEDCREKKRNDFGEKGVWCGGVAEKCGILDERLIEPVST